MGIREAERIAIRSIFISFIFTCYHKRQPPPPKKKIIIIKIIKISKFFALRVSPPAHPVPALVPKWSKIAPARHQNGTKNLQNRAQMGPRGAKMEPKWRQDGVRMAEKSKKNTNATKKRVAFYRVPPLEPKKWPTWPQLGSQVGAKMDKKSMQKSIKNLMHLGIDFW